MKVWFTSQELADAAVERLIPDLPRTRRGVDRLIEREGWSPDRFPSLCRPRAGQGGGFEYHVDLLTVGQRLAYARRFVVVAARDLRPSIPEGDSLTGEARKVRDARLVILAVADRFRAGTALSMVAGDSLFADLYNGGLAEISPWVRAIHSKVSARTLARWRARAQAGTAALGYDPALSRKDTGILDAANGGEVKIFVLAMIAKNPFFSAKHVRNAVAGAFGDTVVVRGRDVKLPPIRAFQRSLNSWRQSYRNELTRLTDPDGYRSKVEFVATGTTTAARLNEMWQIDASPLDAIALSGKRQTIYAAVDIYSRRLIIMVTPTPRAEAVGLLIRKCLIAWGVPERIKTDNGSDFRANATERLLAALGIDVEYSRPYEPRAKGVIERAIGTFQRDFATTIPGFIGHSVADRRVIENRKSFDKRLGTDDVHLFDADMTEAEVAVYADHWATDVYAHTEHDGLGGRTPFAAAAAYAGQVRRLDSPAALDVLLAPVAGGDGRRTVTKSGIRVDGEQYLIGTVMPGTDVFCRRDPADLGRLYVFAADGERFLGQAVCWRLAGLDPVATIARVRAEQKAYLDGQLKPIRAAMRRIGPRQVADAQRRAKAAEAGTLLPFERKTTHDTPALAAAKVATMPNEAAPLSAAAAQRHQEIAARPLVMAPAPNVTPLRTSETREQRFRRAVEFEEQIKAGKELPTKDAQWLGGYQAGPEYAAMRRMLSAFGDRMRF